VNRRYFALVVTPDSTEHYELIFKSPPALREVLDKLHHLIVWRNQMAALPLIINLVRLAHVGGQAEEEFNESEVLRHQHNNSWLRIYDADHLQPPEDGHL
jgi:hypothetical protein